MKIGILGQGISGLFLALMIKKDNPKIEVTVIDKNMFPGKKMLATGNGRFNVGNFDINSYSYNNSIGDRIVFDMGGPEGLCDYLSEIGIQTRRLGNLIYPYSLSAKNTLTYLLSLLNSYKVEFINNETVLDYVTTKNKVRVKTNKKEFVFDKFVISSGGAANPNLGGDTKIYDVLKSHGYKINTLRVGLCPIKTVEETRTIESERLKAKIKLIIDKEIKYEEEGEVLIKKDGLSGIAIFNAASMISRNKKFKKAIISLDIAPEYESEELMFILKKSLKRKNIEVLQGFYNIPTAKYILKRLKLSEEEMLEEKNISDIVTIIKNLTFTYLGHYSFKDSQITIGGLSLDEIDENLSSKREEGIYFTGEVIDIDGLCGGYNIMFAIASAYKVAEDIKRSWI